MNDYQDFISKHPRTLNLNLYNQKMFMFSFIKRGVFVGVGCLVAGMSLGQSFNVEFNNGTQGIVPSSSYAAMGEAGVWNPFNIGAYSATGSLMNLDGSQSNVSISASWGGNVYNTAGPGTGNFRYLLQDSITSISDAGIRFSGLMPGLYTVILYTSNAAGSYRIADNSFAISGGNSTSLVSGVNYRMLNDFQVENDSLTIFATTRTTNLAGIQLVHHATPVPEPATLAILGLGALVGTRKVRRSKN